MVKSARHHNINQGRTITVSKGVFDHHRRSHLLRAANADQINAVSELVLNTIKEVVPRTRDTVRILRPYRDPIRALAQRKRSIKNRRQLMMNQSGGALWSELNHCFKRCCRQ